MQVYPRLVLRRALIAVYLALSISAAVHAQAPAAAKPTAQVQTLRITVLSTMLVGETKGIGEWGFSALVEADGHRILVDTGARPETVLNDARELNVDLSSVHEVILTHNHGDHVGGLMTLRREMMKQDPAAAKSSIRFMAGVRRDC